MSTELLLRSTQNNGLGAGYFDMVIVPSAAVVYLAGPYRASSIFGVALNIYRAWRVAKRLWRAGFVVICPHSNTAFMGEELFSQINCQVFLDGDLELVRRSDAVFALPGWRWSSGTCGEVKEARRHNKPVFYDIEEVIAWRNRNQSGG